MDHIWDKLDGYTKSDYLYSSDDESQETYLEQTRYLCIDKKEFYQAEVGNESLCSDDVDIWQESSVTKQEIQEVVEKQKTKVTTYEKILDEMKKNELHCSSETRNVQEKIDEMSAEKSQQKEELNEMQHKAQVISKSARMSATEVLSTITSSETIYHEDSGQMDEYYDRIRSTNTGDEPPEQDSNENDGQFFSSDVDLPNITPLSTTLNTGVMKSKANVARQGSMKARRKPTAVKRKSWTPGMDEFNIREEDEMLVEDVQENEQGDVWDTRTQPQKEDEIEIGASGSITPSDSSSEDEKEVVKPHQRSGVALPGLGDALKIQMTRSELKRPTALSLAKTAKDAKDNEVTKEDKVEASPSKPEWMKEVEERKKKPRAAPRRKHKTLPARCSELDTFFEQRKQTQPTETLDPTTLEGSREAKNSSGENIDPELQKMFEKRKNLTPLEIDGQEGGKEVERPKSFHGDQVEPELSRMFEKRKNLKPLEAEEGSFVKDTGRPKSFHGDQIDPELSKMFEKRKNLKPLEVGGKSSAEGSIAKETERPKSFHGDQMDSELNKMFQRRKNLKSFEGRASNGENEDEQGFKPRNLHLQNSQATELDKIFEKRKQLRPVEGVKTHAPQGRCDESLPVVIPSANSSQTSGIVRARFHDTKLEPLPNRCEVKVATVAEVEVRTPQQVHESRRRLSPENERTTSGTQFDREETRANVGQRPVDGQGRQSRPPHPPTSGAQVAEFVFDGRGTSHATVGRVPGEYGKTTPALTEHSNSRQERAKVDFDRKGSTSNPVGGRVKVSGNHRANLNPVSQEQRIPPAERNAGREPTGAQIAQFVFDGSAAASRATVGRIPGGEKQKPIQGSQNYGSPKTRDSDDRAKHNDHVSNDHMIAARGHVIDSRDVDRRHEVIPPTSSKFDTQSFIEQLSGKKVAGKTQVQGKSVSESRPRNNPPESRPNHINIEQGKWQVNRDYPLPQRSHHGDLQPRSYVSTRSNSYSNSSPPEELPPRNLPPIDSSSPAAQTSNLRSLHHSLSYPPNSQFSSHPPLNTKTSGPQLSHSPDSAKEGRVATHRTVRVREVISPVRDVGADLNTNDNERRLHSYANPGTGESVGNSNEFVRDRVIGNSFEVVRRRNKVRNDLTQENSVKLQNSETPANINRYSDPLVFNGVHGQEYEKKMRGRSPIRLDRQQTQRARSTDTSDSRRVRSPERFYDQRITRNSTGLPKQKINSAQNDDTSGYQKMNALRSPKRLENQGIRGNQNADQLNNEKGKRVKSPERSDLRRANNLAGSNYQVINRLQGSDKSGDSRIDAFRNPEDGDNQRPRRGRSPQRFGNQKIGRIQYHEGSNIERMNTNPTSDRSGPQRVKEDFALRDRFRDTNESFGNYPLVKQDVFIERHSDFKTELNSRQHKKISDGIQNDKNFENRNRDMKNPSGQRSDVFRREVVERPKPVAVTVMSVSDGPVHVKSHVTERVGSRDGHTRGHGECKVNGVVNGDVGRRGVRTDKSKFEVPSSESSAIPKWKQELREKKRLQKERQGENSIRKKDDISVQQSGNDMAEWQKRLQGIRKTWGAEETEDPRGMDDKQNNVPGFLKDFQQKKENHNVKDDDTETFV